MINKFSNLLESSVKGGIVNILGKVSDTFETSLKRYIYGGNDSFAFNNIADGNDYDYGFSVYM
ncbi:MAG: hypothetical protein N2485_03350 [bacterium]|nr:hypothetical protein [bacterium]